MEGKCHDQSWAGGDLSHVVYEGREPTKFRAWGGRMPEISTPRGRTIIPLSEFGDALAVVCIKVPSPPFLYATPVLLSE